LAAAKHVAAIGQKRDTHEPGLPYAASSVAAVAPAALVSSVARISGAASAST
jgi:hypothetical protein